MIPLVPKPMRYTFGKNRRAIHILAAPGKPRTVQWSDESGQFYPSSWALAHRDRVRFPGSPGLEGEWIVDGFLPEGAGIFATRVAT